MQGNSILHAHCTVNSVTVLKIIMLEICHIKKCTYHKIFVNIDGTKKFGGRMCWREEGREPHSPLRNRVSNGSQT